MCSYAESNYKAHHLSCWPLQFKGTWNIQKVPPHRTGWNNIVWVIVEPVRAISFYNPLKKAIHCILLKRSDSVIKQWPDISPPPRNPWPFLLTKISICVLWENIIQVFSGTDLLLWCFPCDQSAGDAVADLCVICFRAQMLLLKLLSLLSLLTSLHFICCWNVFISIEPLSLSLSQCFEDEPLIPQRAMLPVLLSTVPQQDCLQAGLPAPWAYLQPHVRWEWQPMDAAPLRARRLAVLLPREGRHWVFHDSHLKREPHCLHVCPLLPQCPVHAIILSWKCSGLGSDEQLLHRSGFTHQLQRLLLRLLGLRGQFWETLREKPVRWCRRCMAGTSITVRRWWWWMEGRWRPSTQPVEEGCSDWFVVINALILE